jgi:hypothetical protein
MVDGCALGNIIVVKSIFMYKYIYILIYIHIYIYHFKEFHGRGLRFGEHHSSKINIYA